MKHYVAEKIVDTLGDAGYLPDSIILTPDAFDAVLDVIMQAAADAEEAMEGDAKFESFKKESERDEFDLHHRFAPTMDSPYVITDPSGRNYSAYNEKDANYVRDTVGGTIENRNR